MKYLVLLLSISSFAFSAAPDDGSFTIYKDGNPVPRYGSTDGYLSFEFSGGEIVRKFIISGNDQLISSPCEDEYLLESPIELKTVSSLIPFSGNVKTADGQFTIYRSVLLSDEGMFQGLVPGSKDAYFGTISFSDSNTANMQIYWIFTYFTGLDTGAEFCLIEDNYELKKET